MSEVMDRLRQAATEASTGPLADARDRPAFRRVAAESPFPSTAGREDYVARFRTELEVLAGKVYGPFDPEVVARTVIELIGEKGRGDAETRGHGEAVASELVSDGESQDSALSTQHSAPVQLLAWSDERLSCPGLADRLRQASLELVPGEVPGDEGHQERLEMLAELRVGLTGAMAGLADTGSIVVASGQGRPRIASLLPPVHIAVLPVSHLYPTMADWLEDGGATLLKQSSNVVTITGPSRTADIELTLALGMHGPKELHVVLLEG